MKLTSLKNFKALFQAYRHLYKLQSIVQSLFPFTQNLERKYCKVDNIISKKNTLEGEFKYETHFKYCLKKNFIV